MGKLTLCDCYHGVALWRCGWASAPGFTTEFTKDTEFSEFCCSVLGSQHDPRRRVFFGFTVRGATLSNK